MDDQGRHNDLIESARRCTESGVLSLQVHQFDFCAAGGASGEANNEAVFKLAGIRPGESLAHALMLCLHSASLGVTKEVQAIYLWHVMKFLEVLGIAQSGQYLHLEDEQWLAPIMLLLQLDVLRIGILSSI